MQLSAMSLYTVALRLLWLALWRHGLPRTMWKNVRDLHRATMYIFRHLSVSHGDMLKYHTFYSNAWCCFPRRRKMRLSLIQAPENFKNILSCKSSLRCIITSIQNKNVVLSVKDSHVCIHGWGPDYEIYTLSKHVIVQVCLPKKLLVNLH